MKAMQIKIRLLIVSGFVFSQPVFSQISTVSKLPELLKLADIDSVQKIERLAALKFHNLINNYRLENKLDTLVWDEALWVTSRNHDIWMAEKEGISHMETKGSKFFTGEMPGERYKFATSKKGKCNWSGENALENFSADGRTISGIADRIAVYSFEQWKDSPGHNENMLTKRHMAHGVAFFLKDGRVYGTDLFVSNIDNQFNNLSPEQIDNMFVINVASTGGKANPPSEKRIKLNTKKLELDLVGNLYSMDGGGMASKCAVKRNNTMEKASSQHSKYMCSSKKLTHTELKNKRNFSGENEEKRMMKASRGFYFFSKHKTRITESVAFIEADAKNLNFEKLILDIHTQLDKDKKVESATIEVGYGVTINRSKNILRFYVTRIIGNKEA